MANLLSNTTIGGYQSIHTGNIGSYAITSLSGYATQSWVQSQAYITSSNNIYYVNPGAGNGVGFWGNSPTTYGITMANENVGYGVIYGLSEYHLYFSMTGGGNRGFVFRNDAHGAVTQIGAYGWQMWRGELYPGYNNGGSGSQTSYYIYGNTNNAGLRTNGNWLVNGNLYIGSRDVWFSDWFNQAVKTDSNPTFASIYLNGTQLTGTQTQQLKNTLDVTTLPYKCDIYVEGDANTFYPVHFMYGDQDVWRRIIIKRGYYEDAPWDPIGTGAHHGGLLLDWEGNFGGWGGAEYADRIRVFNQSYTDVCADMYIYTHSMGYVFMLRGGHAIYHIYSDQPIRGYYQEGTPDIAYSTATKFYNGGPSYPQYDVYAPAPLTLAQTNPTRIDSLRTKKQSLLDGRYLRQGVDISGIGTVTATNFLANNAFYLNGTSYYLNSYNGGIYTNARFETAGNLVVQGNSYLGNGNGDEVHINDILRVGATDSGDAHFYFGEGGSAGSDYGSHWYWDSGYTFTWNTRNNGTDTALFDYVTNDTTYINWRRNFHMQNREVNYVSQLHFNAGTRFINYNANYLYFQSGATSEGGIIVRDANASVKGYSGYFDSNGFGLLNSSGSWGIRLNPGNSGTYLFHAGNERFRTDGSGAYVTGRLDVSNYIYTPQHIIAKNIQGPYQVLNLDTIKEPGLYQYDGGIGGTQPLSTNWSNVKTIEIGSSSRYSQFVMPYSNSRIFYRIHLNDAWQSYVELVTSGNIGSQSVSYATTAGALSSMNISQFSNNSGYLTGITSGQVTSALGYTPYNSSNPSGYVNNAFAGAMNQNVRTTDAPTFDYINTTMPNKSFNPFGGAKMHDAVLTNMMAGKWDRFDVTINGVLEPNAAFHLSNQNYEEYNSANLYGTDAGETKIYNINFQKLEGYFNSNGITYSSGFFDLNFYSTPFPASWSCRARNRDGVWTNVTLTKIGGSLLRGVSPHGNWLTDIEYTLTARTGAPYVTGNITYGISEFEFFGSRIALSQGAVISAVGGYMSGVLSTKNGNSNNWNTAYSWGNHASAGYVTSSGSVSYASTAGSLSSMNISQFTNNSGYITGISFANVSSKPTTISGYGITDAITTANIGSQSVSYAATAGSAPNGGNINSNYDVAVGVGNGLRFWGGSDSYKVSMGVGSLYQYGPVTDYSIKMQMNDSSTDRGFTWGRISYAPIAALNSTSGDLQIAGSLRAAGHLFTSYNGNNILLRTADAGGDAGILVQNSSGSFKFQIYGNGGDYGFLNGNWAGWDIRKTIGGVMYMNNNNSYYIQTDSTSNFYALNIQGNAVVHAGNIGSQSVSNANTVGGYAAAQTYTATGNAAGSYLGGHYSSGGTEKPNSATFGAGKLKLAMLSGGNLGFGGSWNDVLWLSGYTGGDVKSSHALVFDKYSTNVWVSDQNFDSATWGTGYLLLSTANYNSYSPSLTGSGASGTWGINVTGSAGSAGNTATIDSNPNRTDSTAYPVVWSNGNSQSPNYSCAAVTIQSSTGKLTATSFTGAGTGLTGTAASLSIGGNAATATNVAWTGVTGRPTALSQFSNDLGNYGGWITSSGSISGSAGSVTGLTLNSSANGINPDSVTQNQIGYDTSVSLFSQSDGGLYSSAYSTSWIHQIHGDFRTGQIAIRGKNSGTWQAWRTVLDSSNFSTWAAAASHTHTIANITGLQTALDGKQVAGSYAAASHTHTISDVTGLQTALDGKALSSHTHTIANVTGLQTALDGKQASGSYLTTSGKAADSELFDGTDSIYFVKGNGINTLGRRTTNLNGTNSAQGLSSGFYDGTGMSNMPTSDWYHLIVSSHYNSATSNQYEFQLATAFWDKSNFYVRSISPGDVGPWRTLIHNGNIGSQSVSYASTAGSATSATTATTATVASQLNKFGDIYGQDWNSYYVQDKLIAAAVYGHSGANRPNLTYDYGVALSYGESTGPRMQMYFPENSSNQGTIFRKGTYRTGWNGNWSTWKTFVEQEGNVCTIVGGVGAGLEVHGNPGYNQDPLTYFLLRGAADTSWKAFKVRLTGDAGGQDIEFRRIAENGADSRMWYVPRGGNTVNFDYPIVQPSDSRLKDNITPISTPVDKIKSLRGVEFDWNSGEQVGTHDVGLIAQDVEAVLPEAVTTQEDGYKNLAYTKVIPLLVEAMKEQQAMIEALKAEIELLKNK